ncbi:methyltransferase domain-containing protein [Vibrio kasasachensis]|uniref:methyltransferase domain-containing protein n=1 Tax=Vibrio kasasachensis TaxID=2910248 RepID=UPI003D0A66C4
MKNNKTARQLYQVYAGTKFFIKRPRLFYSSFKQMFSNDTISTIESMNLSIKWLLLSQERTSDQGYSRGYYFGKNWDKSYIETTGYIISTMLEFGEKYNRQDCIDSALRAGKWLLSQQLESGAFPDIDKGKPLAFDTGQVLYGLNSLSTSKYVNEIDRNKYLVAAERAANWLSMSLDEDGSWSSVGFNNMAHTYYSRVAYAMASTGCILDREDLKASARRNIEWVLTSQLDNGFYSNLKMMDGIEATLHPIVYVLEGLLDYYELTKEQDVLDSLLVNASRLKDINLTRDIILGSQYDESFNCTNDEKCMTGLAQWAGICMRLYKLTSVEGYLTCARKTLYFLNAKQFKKGKDIKGAFPGSLPFWGVYSPYSWNNWPVKFYVDALMLYIDYEMDYKEESMNWTQECFSFCPNTVMPDFSYVSERIYSYLEAALNSNCKVLDLGCGEGKYVRRLNSAGFNVQGVDPCFFSEEDNISLGSCYNIPACSDTYDKIYISETMQHVKYIDSALYEVSRVLKSGGELIIIDRNPISVYGILKPYKEIMNKWMYPAYSPFSEKWHKHDKWFDILEKSGFDFLEYVSITNKDSSKYSWFSKYHIIRVKKVN